MAKSVPPGLIMLKTSPHVFSFSGFLRPSSFLPSPIVLSGATIYIDIKKHLITDFALRFSFPLWSITVIQTLCRAGSLYFWRGLLVEYRYSISVLSGDISDFSRAPVVDYRPRPVRPNLRYQCLYPLFAITIRRFFVLFRRSRIN